MELTYFFDVPVLEGNLTIKNMHTTTKIIANSITFENMFLSLLVLASNIKA